MFMFVMLFALAAAAEMEDLRSLNSTGTSIRGRKATVSRSTTLGLICLVSKVIAEVKDFFLEEES